MSANNQTPTTRFPVIALALWAVFAFLVPSVALTLNIVDVLAFPLGYFMTAQGAFLAFILIGWMSLRRARRNEVRAVPGE